MDLGKLANNLFRVGSFIAFIPFIVALNVDLPVNCVVFSNEQCARIEDFSGLPEAFPSLSVVFWLGVAILILSQVLKYTQKK